MRIFHLSTSDSEGGAARAAYRIHRSIVDLGVESRMLVLHKETDDDCVRASFSLKAKLLRKLGQLYLSVNTRRWHTDNPVLHTFGKISCGLQREIGASEADILHLHWISEMLSISDIGRLGKPIIWTLHDMWAFCGGEHYAPDDEGARFRRGYRHNNRPNGERGPDLNRKAWQSKLRAWKKSFTIVSPSRWLADCARESVLFKDAAIYVIPNPLNTTWPWRPIPRDVARQALNISADKHLILMGAYGGTLDLRKGGDLLQEAVGYIASQKTVGFELMIYGQSSPSGDNIWPCPVHWLGKVRDDRVLALAYSAADVMVVPSRQEAFGQTASEAHSCGTPVAAFAIGGLTDIVLHRETGWLAQPFDTKELAEGILWILSDRERRDALSRAARKIAVDRFSFEIVARQYEQLYEKVVGIN